MFKLSRNSITVLGFSIHYYGILIALGALLGVLLAMSREKKLGFPKDTVLDAAIVCIPAAVICARLYYVIFEWELYRDDIWSIFNLRNGGLAIYGGVIGGLASGYVLARVKKTSFLALADLIAPSIALGQAVGRWGNFFNQEAYGVAISNPAHMFFPIGVFIESDGLWHYATFFYESIWCLLVALALIILEKKRPERRRGDIIMWYGFLYAIERAAVEGLRTDSLYLGTVRVSQMLSLMVIVLTALAFSRRSTAPLWLRLLSPAACLAALVVVGLGIWSSASLPAIGLFAAALGLTSAMYLAGAARRVSV